MILVGDIGGTNTTLAAVEHAGEFVVKSRERFRTPELSGITEALAVYRERHEDLWSAVESCCLSGAGPVRQGVCRMTNVHFIIDRAEVERVVGKPTFVINDFSAICYALPLLETHAAINTTVFRHPDGSTPAPHGKVRAVVGAGTGLGTGYLIEDRGHYVAHPSEGGHTDFGSINPLTDEFTGYLRQRFPMQPGAEQYVSGQGIANLFAFFWDTSRLDRDDTVTSILEVNDIDRPEAIARAAASHEGCARIMRYFVELYAQYASNTALFFLPFGGLYLAGGIAAKNEEWFTRDDRFMRTFESNYNERITPLLRQTPVILIKDYEVSLYGAAHAAVSLA
jgi:glucokinase